MNQQAGLVTVVTATFNMARYIGETLDSILAQDYPFLESVVIDDGSTDNTGEVLAPYVATGRVRVIRQENAGQTVAKNRGIAEARGEFVAFCDADDTWRPDKLSQQVNAFAQNPRIAVVYSDMAIIDGNGDHMPVTPVRRYSGEITAPLLIDNFVPFPTTIVRRSVLTEVGGFDESLTMSIDYDLWLRISVRYLFHHIPEPLANYRVWEGQMSHRMGERLENFMVLLKRFLAENPHCATLSEQKTAWAHFLVTRGYWHFREGRRRHAAGDYLAAMRFRFFDKRLWRRIGALVISRN